MAHSAPHGAGHDWGPVIRAKALKVVLLLLFVIADPFGLQRATLEASRNVTDRLASVVYTAPSANLVRVVMVEDASVAQSGWPPSLNFWANLIERIEEAGPRAIFLDVSLTQERPPAEDFAAMIDARRAAQGKPPVPLIVADSGRAAVLRGTERPCQGDLPAPIAGADPETIGADVARRAVSTLLPDLACAATGIVFFDWIVPSDPRAYPLWIARPPLPYDPRSARAVEGPSAALALAQIVCADPPVRQRLAWCATTVTAEAARSLKALVPRWPLGAQLDAPDSGLPREEILAGLTAGCVLYEPTTAARRFEALAEMLTLDLFGNLATFIGRHLGWPRIRLDGVSAVSAPGAAPDARPSAHAPCQIPAPVIGAGLGGLSEAQRALLAGTVVLIGDARATSPDRVPSPLHVTVPGVFLHAVALENLLSTGQNYATVQPKLGTVERGKFVDWGLKSASILLALALACRRETLIAAGLRTAPAGLGRIGAPGVLWPRLGMLVVSLALMFLGVIAIYIQPSSWFAPVAIALVAAFLCVGNAGGGGRAEDRHARARRLTRQFRLATMLFVLAGLGAAGAFGLPASNPLLVIMVALGVAIPVIDQSPLEH
jgi:hypothetical protein